MIVFLVRHAHAVDEAPGLPDEARHLNPEGRKAARALGERLKWYDCTPTAIWTSPATRAVQTAELFVAGLGWDGPVEAQQVLAPVGDVRASLALIRRQPADAQLVIVGHEPGISGLGGLLVHRDDFPSMKKAQCARLDDVAAQRAEGKGAPLILRWLFAYADEAPFPAA